MQVFKTLSENFITPQLLLFLLVIPPLSIGMAPPRPLLDYECVRVIDGDTVVLKRRGHFSTVRLSNIDAPESKQKSLDGVPIGEASTKNLIQLIEGRVVQLKIEGKDIYQRKIGEIFYRGESINLSMVKSGFATSYPSKSLFVFRQAESLAKRKRLGIWKSEGFLSPKSFRQLSRRKNNLK